MKLSFKLLAKLKSAHTKLELIRKNVFLEFFPLDETQVPLMDNIKEFVIYYKKKFDKFLSLMSEAKVKYDNFKESLLDHDKKAQAYFAEEERTELNVISERIQELKSKKNEINSNKNKLNAEQEKINEKIGKINSKIDVEETKDAPETKQISIYKNEIEASKKDIEKINIEIEKLDEKYKEIEKEINTLRKNKKVGGKKEEPLKDTDNNIKDLLNKKDIPFKDKDENVSFEDRKNEIKKRFDNIKKDYRKLKVSTYIPNSVNKDMILEKFINKKGDTLFEQILNNYQKDVKEKNLDIAKANFYESVENNNLDPIKELEITFIDKLIFAFLIIFLRYAGLYMTYRFIDNKFVKSIKEAIIYYSLSYVAVLFAFLVIVNIDLLVGKCPKSQVSIQTNHEIR
jgi:DNA repair exonuclease SbcCD ATPase subunit